MSLKPISTASETNQKRITDTTRQMFGTASPGARQQQLLFSEYMSDVLFRVGTSGELIHAHKIVLTLASEVWYNVFNGSFSESHRDNLANPIDVPDIEPASFREILRYVYCEKVDFTSENLMNIYYGAQKYMLTALSGVCESHFERFVNEDAVLIVFNENRLYGFGKVDAHCLRIIRDNPLKCFESASFLKLSEPAIQLIAASETMNCQNEQLRQAIQKWCKANGSDLKISPNIKQMQCHKLHSFSASRFENSVNTELKLKWPGKLHLYGLGICVCNSYLFTQNYTVTIKITPPDFSVTETVLGQKDLYVAKIMFPKLTLLQECTINVSMRTSGLGQILCMNDFLPVVVGNNHGVTVTEKKKPNYNGYGSRGCNCVAYILYNVED